MKLVNLFKKLVQKKNEQNHHEGAIREVILYRSKRNKERSVFSYLRVEIEELK